MTLFKTKCSYKLGIVSENKNLKEIYNFKYLGVSQLTKILKGK
jgi:hypothetical protein